MNKIPYITSGLLFLIFIIVSGLCKMDTNNTVWGMFGFFLFCMPSLAGSIYNAYIYRKQNRDLRFLFYFLSFVFSVWSIASVVVMILIANGTLQ